MGEPYLSQRLNAPGFSHTSTGMLKKGFEGPREHSKSVLVSPKTRIKVAEKAVSSFAAGSG
jgi:hypothetical protein